MESIIAELVLSGTIYKKTDFVLYICRKCCVHLLDYIHLYEELHKHKSKSKYFYNLEDWLSFIKSKEDIENMTLDKLIVENRDFSIIDDIHMYNSYGFEKLLTEDCLFFLRQLNYIYEEYKYYLEDLHELNTEVYVYGE